MAYEIIREVPATIYYRGERQDNHGWRVGVGRARGYDDRGVPDQELTVFGLIFPRDYEISHMAYTVDRYFNPPEVLAKRREPQRADDPEHRRSWLFFDAGTNPAYPEIRISGDELERVFRELGLLP